MKSKESKYKSFICGCTLMSRVGTRASQRQPGTLFSGSVIWMKIHVYWLWFKKTSILFLIGGSLAVRCCRYSLKGPAYTSGSQVSLFSCSVIYYDEHFIGELNKLHTIPVWLWYKKAYTSNQLWTHQQSTLVTIVLCRNCL